MITLQPKKLDSMTLVIPAPKMRAFKLPAGRIYSDRRTKRNRTRSQKDRSWRKEW